MDRGIRNPPSDILGLNPTRIFCNTTLVKNKPEETHRVRGLLKTKFPSKENEIKITLTKLIPYPDPEIRKFIIKEREQ